MNMNLTNTLMLMAALKRANERLRDNIQRPITALRANPAYTKTMMKGL